VNHVNGGERVRRKRERERERSSGCDWLTDGREREAIGRYFLLLHQHQDPQGVPAPFLARSYRGDRRAVGGCGTGRQGTGRMDENGERADERLPRAAATIRNTDIETVRRHTI